ncbi:MAG: CsbD family protein [Candidatus Rokubacteria bacterium]|nr:CsbD family protein [Candidatus Rokubacteria bacterium]
MGQASNDSELEAEGTADRATGNVREAYGDVKDRAKRAAEEVTE